MAKSRRSAEKHDFWQLVLQEYQGSGLSVRAFCERERLSEPSFYAWRKRLLANEPATVETADGQHVGGASLIPVRVVAADDRSEHIETRATAPMEILTPSGYTLRIDERVEVNRLGALLGVLAAVEGEAASC